MTLEEKLGYVMLGYEKAITNLMHLDYTSETIQVLVHLIYQLQCNITDAKSDTTDQRQCFAKEHVKMMTSRSKDYSEMFRKEEYEYLMNAVKYFGM